ncbi:MAG: phosphoglycolate phosphatase [Nitrososphaerales archaeon]
MVYRALAVDIDGTLTEDGGMVHLGSLSMLRVMERLGVKVIYVTGRSSVEAYILSVFGGTTRIAVGENGGVVTNGPDAHKLLADKAYPQRAYEFLRTRIENVKLKDVFPRMTEVVLERTFDIRMAEQVLKESRLPVTITDSKYAYHLNHVDINKAVGFRVALDMLGINSSESIAIGDSETDVPLFKTCGYSIALGNAEIDVQLTAKHSVASSDGEGLVEALDHIAYKFLGVRDGIQTLDK